MERRNWRLAVSILQLVATGCSSPGGDAARVAANREAVLEVLEAYYSDFSARDWEALGQHFWSGSQITTIWQPPGEKSDRVVPTAIEDFVARAPSGPRGSEVFEEKMLNAEIRLSNDLAQAWVRYGTTFGHPDSIRYWEGIDAFALLKHGGMWKIASLVFTSNANE
jgi:hypothetical protein